MFATDSDWPRLNLYTESVCSCHVLVYIQMTYVVTGQGHLPKPFGPQRFGQVYCGLAANVFFFVFFALSALAAQYLPPTLPWQTLSIQGRAYLENRFGPRIAPLKCS